MRHYIYIITNKLNGKIYIGKHSSKRLNDNYFGSGVALKRAILKYGRENFIKEILIECIDEEELNIKEIHFINKYNTFKKGYNMTMGGEGMLGHVPTSKQRNKQSLTQKRNYENNPDYKKKLSEKAKLRVGKLNPFFGKKLTEMHIEKLRENRIKAITGPNNPSARPVICIETSKKYNLAKDAAKDVGLAYSTTILKCCNGTRKSAGGFTWRYVEND
jgi:group I intron endonuclease